MRTWSLRLDANVRDDLVERVATRPGRVQLVQGASGIGKTTLAAAVTRRLVESGHSLLPVIGVRELSAIPLAAMAPLLALGDADPAASTGERLQRLFAAVSNRGERHVLAVDDGPLLDDVSASTVYQLVRIHGVRCIMTARTGDAIEGPLRRLFDDGLVDTTDLGGLTDAQAAGAVEDYFGTKVHPQSLHRIVQLAGGNPLFLREIVFAAERRDAIGETPSGITIDSERVPPRIADAVERRFAELDPAGRRLVELLAVAEPLPTARLGDPRLVDALVDEQILELRLDQAYLAHPIFAEVIEGSLSVTDAGARRAEAAALLGTPVRDDERFKVITLLEGGPRPPSVDELVWASSYAGALDDHDLALRLAESALEAGGGFAAQVARARALAWSLRFDEADASFAAAAPLPRNDTERALLAESRALLAAYGRRDFAGAASVLEDALGDIRDPELRARIEVDIGKWRLISGRPVTPMDELLTSDNPALALNSAVFAAARGVYSADIVAIRAALVHGRRFQGMVVFDIPHGQPLLSLTEVFLMMFEGDVEGARRVARDRVERPPEPEAGMWWFALGLLEFYSGRVREARASSEIAVDLLSRIDIGSLLAAAIALRAATDAQLGDRASAESQLRLLTETMRQHVNAATLAAEAEAWLLFDAGDPEGAMRHIAESVTTFSGSGLFGVAVPTARFALELGRADLVIDSLRMAIEAVPGPYVEVMAELAEALVAGSGERVLAASTVLARMGHDATALAGARSAAQLFGAAGLGEARRKAELLAASVTEGVSGNQRNIRDSTELTERERAIALAAAQRARSREIADRLGLSVRTVDNHLRNIYRKLGVSSRDELARELGLESGL